ncbi:MAG: epoxyqueuosine reductase [Oscillospiraceae bacterium]|nr:epoxyqueuosine reductase [Oscillospiraceae bacterium]
MITSAEVKQLLFDMGADLCKIASIDRFDDAPEGFHPLDVLPSCKSVVVFAKKFPAGTTRCNTNIPYTITRNTLCTEMDIMSVKFCGLMEECGITAVPTGTISNTRLDSKTGRHRSIVSAKHCASNAGLGRIGKNTLLVTPEYGNMVWLNAVLTDAELEPDEILGGSPCEENCSICIDNCPATALGEPEMKQGACFMHAFKTEPAEELNIKCHNCRTLCPNCLGSENKHIKI